MADWNLLQLIFCQALRYCFYTINGAKQYVGDQGRCVKKLYCLQLLNSRQTVKFTDQCVFRLLGGRSYWWKPVRNIIIRCKVLRFNLVYLIMLLFNNSVLSLINYNKKWILIRKKLLYLEMTLVKHNNYKSHITSYFVCYM